MPRPTDIAKYATQEARSRGGINSGKKRRELKMTLRERIARKLEDHADEIAQVFLDAMKADFQGYPDHQTRIRAITAALNQAFGMPPQEIQGGQQIEITIMRPPKDK